MSYIGSFLSQVWRLFSVPWPGIGLSASQVIIGIFVVVFSINIAKGILSLVGVVSGSVSGSVKSLRNKGRYNKEGKHSHAKKEKDK